MVDCWNSPSLSILSLAGRHCHPPCPARPLLCLFLLKPPSPKLMKKLTLDEIWCHHNAGLNREKILIRNNYKDYQTHFKKTLNLNTDILQWTIKIKWTVRNCLKIFIWHYKSPQPTNILFQTSIRKLQRGSAGVSHSSANMCMCVPLSMNVLFCTRVLVCRPGRMTECHLLMRIDQRITYCQVQSPQPWITRWAFIWFPPQGISA